MSREIHKINIDTPDSGYEPFPVSIMNRSTHEAMTFDPYLGKPATISYRLNKTGCIRIRLVHRKQSNLLFKTLQDWTDQEFGKYELKWDGCDASGNIIDNKKVLVLFEAKDQGKGLQHNTHVEKACFDPELSIRTIPDSPQKAGGTIELLAAFVGAAGQYGEQDGFQVRYYIDYVFFQSNNYDKGTKEFALKLDTTTLSNSEHLITINVDDHHDHIGSAGVKITVEN